MNNILKHLIIHGRVQGVGFRAWTSHTAHKLGLDGWVRNRADGTVEALISGTQEQIDRMIEACREGPPAARVEKIDATDSREDVETGFTQRSTV